MVAVSPLMMVVFQSTHPRGVRRPWYSCRCGAAGSFNPRTRVGCDIKRNLRRMASGGFNPRTRVGCDISCWPICCNSVCFNPRTRVGCDSPCAKMIARSGKFQSTHPRGVRHPTAWRFLCPFPVSIHAPAWGATEDQPKVLRHLDVSIHAPAWGATSPDFGFLSDVGQFQSTHPRGVRQFSEVLQTAPGGVSIHAPAWGATRTQPPRRAI